MFIQTSICNANSTGLNLSIIYKRKYIPPFRAGNQKKKKLIDQPRRFSPRLAVQWKPIKRERTGGARQNYFLRIVHCEERPPS